uniref:Uncharacterized protein n=1 Tax=Rhizophora mucronata TaxID=61149 RepID=A0A2P2PDN2_RHIMU
MRFYQRRRYLPSCCNLLVDLYFQLIVHDNIKTLASLLYDIRQ